VQSFRGAYIIGAIWNFGILKKIGENSYKYYVSLNFDSTKIEDLKGIYKNLMFIKEDVIRSLVGKSEVMASASLIPAEAKASVPKKRITNAK